MVVDKPDRASKKIAIFGGTFDPIHKGHIAIALNAVRQFKLDKVFFVVAKNPPFKLNSVHLDAEKRFELVRKALEAYDEDKLTASRIELDIDGVSYTYKTIEKFKEIYPTEELYFILGSDSFQHLDSWKNYQYLKDKLKFIVYNREKDKPSVTDNTASIINGKLINISSSFLRECLSETKNTKTSALSLVPESIKDQVYDYYSK